MRLINNTIIRIVDKRANTPIVLPMSTFLVERREWKSKLEVPEVGVCPVFCEPIGTVSPVVGVELGVTTAVVTAVGDGCCAGVGSDVGTGVGFGVGVGARAV